MSELESLGIIAGSKSLPLLIAREARASGIRKIVVVAFENETDPAIAQLANKTTWLRVGQLSRMISAFRDEGTTRCVMAGQIAPKNIARSRAFTRIDLHLEQEIPTFVGNSRITLFGDIENLPNLLNKNWGGLRQLGFPYTSSVVQVQCLNAAGVQLTGAIGTATNPAGGCAQYRYLSYRAPSTGTVSTANSLYLIRVGARFKF